MDKHTLATISGIVTIFIGFSFIYRPFLRKILGFFNALEGVKTEVTTLAQISYGILGVIIIIFGLMFFFAQFGGQ